MSIAIIGAGISGVTTAYFLSKYNLQVDLIESRRYPAMATSYANGGQLSASNSQAWNSWENIITGIKGFIRKDSPVLLNPMPSLEKFVWLISFMKNIKHKDSISYEICKMAVESVKLYRKIASEEKINFDLLNKGIIHFYNTKTQTEKALKANDIYNKAGLERFRITHDDCYKIEPSLRSKKFDSIFYTPSDKTGDIHKFCNNLTKHLIKNKKIKLIKKEVIDLKSELKIYKNIIVCAGVNSSKLAKSINEKLPIYPVKGYSITVNRPGQNAPWVSLLDDENKIVTSRLGSQRLRIAGSAEFNGFNLDIIQNRVRPLINWCTNLFPNINTNDIKPWAGLRPMTPNMLPITRVSKYNKRIWFNTGHGHLGWTLSAITAKNISQKISQLY
tara:strand:- start:461 stop:1624 length:1164 start_codon:yes stop_codon:yes gene_type:complete